MGGALEGLKVLDFTTLLPGPFATLYLSDMGADVLRIVSGSRPDVCNFLEPIVPSMKLSAAATYLGRNKRLMALNLKDPRALEIVHRLIAEYDVVVEQFRPGVMDKLGLGYEDLKKVNPAVIYCSMTGYGQNGPLKDRAGHDINYISRAGLMSYSGRKESGPSLVGMQISDVAAGSCNAVIGILAALYYRKTTGKGQYIDVSLTDGMIAFNAMTGAGFLVDGVNPEPEGVINNGGSLYDFYKTKDGRYISFGGAEPQFSTNFFNAINRPDLIPEGISPKNVAKVKKEVREILLTKTMAEWMAIFDKTDACVEPVLTLAEVFDDPLAKAREVVVDVPLPDGTKIRQLANPIKFSESQMVYKSVGVSPAVGAHTKEVLAGMGYSPETIEEFEKTGLFK
jgi:crotonobetainyl-CoA:carnitine CoA-transferase CaiB-like acyl-CoA transferase